MNMAGKWLGRMALALVAALLLAMVGGCFGTAMAELTIEEFGPDESYDVDDDYDDDDDYDEDDYDDEDDYEVDEPYDVDFTLISPRNNGTIPANQAFTIRWSEAPEVDSWRVEVYRNDVAFSYEQVYNDTKLSPIEAQWATPGAEFVVVIEPVIYDEPNVKTRRFRFSVADEGNNSGGNVGSGIPSDASIDALIGDWTMTENRKLDFNDVIEFDITIYSVDSKGRVSLDWGDSGRIQGRWNEACKTLTVFDNQVYVLRDGVLGGGSRRYSGVAFKLGSRWPMATDSVEGAWRMTENRKELNDVIQFNVDIISIDGNGSVTLDWGDSGRIRGTWDFTNQTLTVFDQQVYVFHNGVLAGGSDRYSGVAIRLPD